MRAVVTEAELKRLAPASRVLVPRGAIVTPAARDYARDHGIVLVEMAGEGVVGASPRGNVGDASTFATDASILSCAGRRSPNAEGRPLVCGGRSQTEMHVQELEMDVQELMEKIARAAIANLGPHATREVLVQVIATVLTRLGYAVGVSSLTPQD